MNVGEKRGTLEEKEESLIQSLDRNGRREGPKISECKAHMREKSRTKSKVNKKISQKTKKGNPPRGKKKNCRYQKRPGEAGEKESSHSVRKKEWESKKGVVQRRGRKRHRKRRGKCVC